MATRPTARPGAKRDGDLRALSLNDLFILRDRIDAEIEERRAQSDSRLRQRGGLVESDGPRYRNPDNASETWSGRGRKPGWLERALATGVSLEELEIVDDRPVHPGD